MEFSFSRRTRHMIGGAAAAALLVMGSSACLADTKAKVDHNFPAPAPIYPDSAQYTGEQGDVTLDVYVADSGKPHRIKVNTSSGFEDLDNAAIEAAANWRYVPATHAGETVSSWTTVKLHFALPQPVQVPASNTSAQTPSPAPAQKN